VHRFYIVVVIPALNADQNLIRLAEEIAALFSPRIVVVNDGSGEKSAPVFESLKRMGCDVLVHTRNLGKGAALKTGIRHALAVYPDALGIVTADADGQHSARDIFCLAQHILERPETLECPEDPECPEGSESEERSEGSERPETPECPERPEHPEGIILGTRSFDEKQVPFKNRWGNKITSAIFWLRTGLRLVDTQTGLRAIPMRYVPAIARADGSRF
jgi:glycosyltransferase involved in cell wall biosynthesis